MWQNRREILITTSLEHYLFRSVRNHSLNYLDKVRVRSEYLKAELERDDNQDDFTTYFPEIGLLEKIETAIRALPEKRQLIFRMAREEGLKYQEIADKLDISIKTVEAQMTLALKQLRSSLKEYHHLALFFMPSHKGISMFKCHGEWKGVP